MVENLNLVGVGISTVMIAAQGAFQIQKLGGFGDMANNAANLVEIMGGGGRFGL